MKPEYARRIELALELHGLADLLGQPRTVAHTYHDPWCPGLADIDACICDPEIKLHTATGIVQVLPDGSVSRTH